MAKRPNKTALRDIDALYRVGVAAAMSDAQLLDQFMVRSTRSCPR